MKTTRLKNNCFALFLVLGFAQLCHAQKINYQLVDSTVFRFQPMNQTYWNAKKVFIAADSVFKTVISSQLDLSHYTLVSNRNEADLILVYSTTLGSIDGKKSLLASPANEKRYLPTGKETSLGNDFDSKKTASQNARSRYANNTSSSRRTTTRSYSYTGTTPIYTQIELYDSTGYRVEQIVIQEELVLEGRSSISQDVAKKDHDLTLEKKKNEVLIEHLERGARVLNNKYFFTKTKVPVFVISVKGKQFDDWNSAVYALDSWINTPGRSLDDPRLPLMEKIFKAQVARDLTQYKDSASLTSVAFHNLAVYQYYHGQPTDAGASLTKAQSHIVYTDRSQRLFHENLILLLFRSASF